MLPLRQIGSSDLLVSAIGLGLWPISGMTTLGVEDRQSIATIQAAIECGINHFDTAYSYGIDGRSDRILKTALNGDYSKFVIASKVGMHYREDGTRVVDCRSSTLRAHCDEILQRLAIDSLDLLYLHCTDGVTSIESMAETMADLQRCGKTRWIGVSNLSPDELVRFSSVAQPIAVQLPLNMLQQQSYAQTMPWLEQSEASYVAYWALMKGLLAGSMSRDHRFDPNYRRLSYPIFGGKPWQQAHDLIDRLRQIAERRSLSVARLVISWTLAQPKIGSVLCGAKTAEQIRTLATALDTPLETEVLSEIDLALAEHFEASTKDGPRANAD